MNKTTSTDGKMRIDDDDDDANDDMKVADYVVSDTTRALMDPAKARAHQEWVFARLPLRREQRNDLLRSMADDELADFRRRNHHDDGDISDDGLLHEQQAIKRKR